MPEGVTTLDPADRPFWERFFTVAPLVVIGSCEDDEYDLAPKHMAMPFGWGDYFGFICTPRHGTYQNIVKHRVFTVTFPRADQVVLTSLAASPRCGEEDEKPIVQALETFPASEIDGIFLSEGYVFLECHLDRIVDGFGINSLIVGRVVATHVADDALRVSDGDDADLVRSVPLLTYVHPFRYAVISDTHQFPLPTGFRR